MPKCVFCAGKVLPANTRKGEPPVCETCELLLRDITDRRIEVALASQLPGLVKDALQNCEGAETKFKESWSEQISFDVENVIAATMPDIVRAEVEGALKRGLASLTSGDRKLKRGKGV